MRKVAKMEKEDIDLVIKISYLLGEMNKKYKHPHGKNPTGIILHALSQLKKGERKKEAILNEPYRCILHPELCYRHKFRVGSETSANSVLVN